MALKHIIYAWIGLFLSLPFPIGVVLFNLGFYSKYWPWLFVFTIISFPLLQLAHMAAHKEGDYLLKGITSVGISFDFISVLIIIGYLFIQSL